MKKLAANIEEQIKLLRDRGVIIDDKTKAEEQLLDIGYYRLGFYAFPFEKTFPQLSNRDHHVKDGIKFRDIVDLYYFDGDLRKILINYINRIEVNIRTTIAYVASMFYKTNPFWYVDSRNVNKKFLDDFKVRIDKKGKKHGIYHTKIRKNNSIIQRHHVNHKSDNYAPAWKTFEFMTLGNLCTLFDALKEADLKDKIAKKYLCDTTDFITYLTAIKDIRNSCAHGACIYNMNLPCAIANCPHIGLSLTDNQNIKAGIHVILYMINIVSHNRRNDMIEELNNLFTREMSGNVRDIIDNCIKIDRDYFGTLK